MKEDFFYSLLVPFGRSDVNPRLKQTTNETRPVKCAFCPKCFPENAMKIHTVKSRAVDRSTIQRSQAETLGETIE